MPHSSVFQTQGLQKKKKRKIRRKQKKVDQTYTHTNTTPHHPMLARRPQRTFGKSEFRQSYPTKRGPKASLEAVRIEGARKKARKLTNKKLSKKRRLRQGQVRQIGNLVNAEEKEIAHICTGCRRADCSARMSRARTCQWDAIFAGTVVPLFQGNALLSACHT